MYGESYGTDTLARMLRNKTEQVYCDIDDGVPYERVRETVKEIMEGAIVLWERLMTTEQAVAATLGAGECHDKNGFDFLLGFECTACGTMTDDYMFTTEDTDHYTQFNYCPNCGRKVIG